jgi:hypothetical protein
MQSQDSYASSKLNPMQSQGIYVSPRLNPIQGSIQCPLIYINPINKKYYIDSSDESITSSDKDSTIIFSSNDSLSSFEDYKETPKLELILDKKEKEKENTNKGFISSICCSCINR